MFINLFFCFIDFLYAKDAIHVAHDFNGYNYNQNQLYMEVAHIGPSSRLNRSKKMSILMVGKEEKFRILEWSFT